MKQIIFGISCLGIILLTAAGILTMEGRTIRENEMDNALSQTVYETLDAVASSGRYSIKDDEAFIAAFSQSLLSEIDAGTKDGAGDKNFHLTVDVTGIDVEKGLLSVHVKEQFTYPNGRIGTIECDAAAVFDQRADDAVHTVTFLCDGQIYEQFRTVEGSSFILPSDPASVAGTFDFWQDEAGNRAAFPAAVERDVTYRAVFR